MTVRGLRLSLACAALGLAGLVMGLATPAAAMPDAKIDAQIRPAFGLLLQPPLRQAYKPGLRRQHRLDRDGDYDGDFRRKSRNLASITVDCGDPKGGDEPLAHALYDLANNGVLYIRSRGGVCHETLWIDHPVIIAGEGVPAFGPGNVGPAKIVPSDGDPCIHIEEGVKGVEIRDLVIEANNAGRHACVEALDADVALIRTSITYQGDASAIFVQGGSLIVRNSVINARTNDAAVLADGAQIDMQQVRITADTRGLDLTPAIGQSRLTQVGVLAQGVGLAGSTGVTIRDQRSGAGEVQISNSVLRGWITGVYVDRGAKLDLVNSRILRARRGVLSDYGQVKVRQNAIVADELGFYASGGRPQLDFNRFIDGGVGFERGVDPITSPNYVYPVKPCGGRLPKGIYCRPQKEIPGGIFDESGFDNSGRYGWEVDGYERGYLRDGPPRPVSYIPPPPPRRHWWSSDDQGSSPSDDGSGQGNNPY